MPFEETDRENCYEKSREQQSREASQATTNRIKTFYSYCDNFFYLDYFNEKHHTKGGPEVLTRFYNKFFYAKTRT
jgi:hypothetical protein